MLPSGRAPTGRSRPPRARRGRVRRGPPARGRGVRVVRRASVPGRPATPGPGRRALRPRTRAVVAHTPARRAERLGTTVVASLEPEPRSTQIARADVDGVVEDAVALSALGASRRDASRAAARTRMPSRAGPSAPRATSTPAWSSTPTASLGGARRHRLGAGRRRRRPARGDLGPGVTAVLVSATLEPDFLRGRLGLDDAARDRPAVAVRVRGASAPLRAGSASRTARARLLRAGRREVLALCRLSRGRALVLTSSYRTLEELATACRAGASVSRLRAGRRSSRAAARALPGRGRLGAHRDGDLLAGRGRPRRVALAARHRQASVRASGRPARPGSLRADRGEGGDWFVEYSVPTAILQLRQGFGRLIREPRRQRGGRDPRHAPAHAAVRQAVSRCVAPLPARRRPR